MHDYLATFDARGHSYNEAMALWPLAREAERRALLQRLDCRPGQTIVDAPAGGGYVADGVAASLDGDVQIVCVEPSARFAGPIAGRHRTLVNPLDNVELPPQSVDGVASLAGLHHIEDRRPIYREWARLLKRGGRLAVGDVASGTGTGEFLNTFVDRHTPGGHAGIFVEQSEFRTQIGAAGFSVIEESLQRVPWGFADLESLGKFCKRLFGIETADVHTTIRELDRLVGIGRETDGEVALQWELRFATAVRA
jgi:ubiquinone/menaquinone biosynthesis C-methylase UbiE